MLDSVSQCVYYIVSRHQKRGFKMKNTNRTAHIINATMIGLPATWEGIECHIERFDAGCTKELKSRVVVNDRKVLSDLEKSVTLEIPAWCLA